MRQRTADMSRLLAVMGVLMGVLAGPARADSGPSSTYSGTADARLVAVDVHFSPTVVFDPLVDGGLSVARAQLDSLGTSQAHASSLYPGGAVISLPGVLGTLSKGEAGSKVIPAYPLYVDSSSPTRPSDQQNVGAYDISAASGPTGSQASATDGATAATARVYLDPATGDAVALAQSTIASLRISQDLSLLGVRSTALVSQAPSGKLLRSSSFDVAALSVAGTQVGVNGEGLEIFGKPAATGGTLHQLVAPVLAALAAQGTTIELVPAEQLPDGVRSAGLRITTTAKSPAEVASGLQSMSTVFTIGGNEASVSNQALPALPGGAVPAGSGTTVPGAAPVGFPANQSGSGPGALPTMATSSVQTPAAQDNLRRESASAALVSAVPATFSTAGLYPVLVIAGIALFAAARLFPHVRRRSS